MVIFHVFCRLLIFSRSFIFEKIFQEYHLSVKQIDPDQARRFVGPDLGPNCLPRLSSAPSIAKVNKELQAGLKIAVAWSKQNKLPINYDKTTYMVLGTKPKEHDTYLLDLSSKTKASWHCYWWPSLMGSPHRLLMFNNIIKNLASQTHLDIRTPEYSKDILSKLYTAATWLWLQHLGKHDDRKYWTSLQVTKTGCANHIKGRFYDSFNYHVW